MNTSGDTQVTQTHSPRKRTFARLLWWCYFGGGTLILVWCAWHLRSQQQHHIPSQNKIGRPFTEAEKRLLTTVPSPYTRPGDSEGFDPPCLPRLDGTIRQRSGEGRGGMSWAVYEVISTENDVMRWYHDAMKKNGWEEWPLFAQKWSTEHGGKASMYRRDGYIALVTAWTLQENTVGIYVHIGSRCQPMHATAATTHTDEGERKSDE